MKKEDLIALGIDEDTAKKVMIEHGKTVTGLNSQLSTAEGERDQFKEQLAANQTELNTLKESAKGNEELTQQLAELQTKYDTSKAESESKFTEQQKDFAIKLALKEALALDEDIVLGQLDKDTIKVVDGKLQGFDEQLKGLQDDKAFLFKVKEEQPNPSPQITVGGNPKAPGNNGSVTKEQFDQMSFVQQSELAKSQPEVFKQITGGNE